jgi:hypothetical protein
MRKILLSLCVLGLFCLALGFTSCQKERACTCVFTDDAGDTETGFLFPSNYDLKNCKELTKDLEKEVDSDVDVKCR